MACAIGRLDPSRRAQVALHVRRVAGTPLDDEGLQRAVTRAFASYGRYWAESFRVPITGTDELSSHMTSHGIEHIEHAMKAGKGAILALPHLGGWDLGAAWLATIGFPATVVVEALEPRELFDWFASLREAMGMRVVPHGPGAAYRLAAALRSNELVGLVTDRDIGGTGVPVEFFGERTTLPGGPALLSLRTGAPLLPAACYSWPTGHHHSVVRPPLEAPAHGNLAERVAAMTQSLASELELLIRRAPEQWHLLQPNWPSDPGYGWSHRAPSGEERPGQDSQSAELSGSLQITPSSSGVAG